MIRVALADDQALVRRGLKALLGEFAQLNVVLEASDGSSLLSGLAQCQADVVLSDIRMPGMGGVELVRALRAQANFIPVVLLTTFDEPELCIAASAAGAQGYLLKDVEPETLVLAIERAARGEQWFAPAGASPELAHTSTTLAPVRTSPRELSILKLVAAGFSNKEIARTLSLTEGTVKNYLTDILLKLDARDRTHAVIKAIKLKLM